MLERFFNALIVVILSGVLLGAFGFQFIKHEEPCPLCLLQRLGMFGVGLGALLNLRFGIKMPHYGIMLLSAFFGGFVALRQISLHVCPTFPLFGVPFWGLSLYTWSFLVFASTVLAVALLLFLPKKAEGEKPMLGIGEKSVIILFLVIAVANMIATLFQCGLGPCVD